ncbi:LVIS_2131 family protein [Xylocopilactobacillus apicola]|nr:LVIS_2131 family protein [Xylocopilactobacillus apicola]
MNIWNLFGVIMWILAIAIVYFLIRGIRIRRLKLEIISQEKGIKQFTMIRDFIDFVIIFVLLISLTLFTFFTPPDLSDHENIKVTYSFDTLILEPGEPSYYVKARLSTGKKPIQYFTYWTAGAKQETDSWHASISDGKDPINIAGKQYKWPTKEIEKYETTSEKAFVATMLARYKNNFWNGLKLKAGGVADEYHLIRVPASSFVKISRPK